MRKDSCTLNKAGYEANNRVVEILWVVASEQIFLQDETQHRNAEYIAAMKQRMEDMEREAEELEGMWSVRAM